MKGLVPDQNFDVMFSFFLSQDEDLQMLSQIPNGYNYDVLVSCNNGAKGSWDYRQWLPLVPNLNQSHTKCKLYFSDSKPLKDYGILESLTHDGDGLYRVVHEDAFITYSSDESIAQTLLETEYRYAGKSPNNYIYFNDELWRIIGLVNTPEGQRIKIIRNESIGDFSWDSSDNRINSGYGVNEWNESDLMKLLNPGFQSLEIGGSLYYQRKSGTCYNTFNNGTTSCDFSRVGLLPESQEMIDTITWNIGSNGFEPHTSVNTKRMYNYERSLNLSKGCNSGEHCNDDIVRSTIWQGKVGLPYASDYGYATSGGTTSRDVCLSSFLYYWNQDSLQPCIFNNWLYSSSGFRLMTASYNKELANVTFVVDGTGILNQSYARYSLAIFPTVYLNSNVKMGSGIGSLDNPYHISLK